MKDALISVIMGVYNEEKTVSKCIDSIISQTYRNWEFIICDDCSTDETYEIVSQYAKKDPRIVLIKNETNLRLAATLNNCLKVAKGEYVARMDADDISMPDRFETQLDFLNSHPEFSVVGSAVEVFDGETVTGIRQPKEYPVAEDILYGPPFMHPTIMMRKSVYDELGGYTVADYTQRGQDKDLWFRFYSLGYVGYNIQQPLLMYHESDDDYKKRTLKTALGYTKISLKGFDLLGFPKWKKIYAYTSIVSALIPLNIKRFIRKYRRKRNVREL